VVKWLDGLRCSGVGLGQNNIVLEEDFRIKGCYLRNLTPKSELSQVSSHRRHSVPVLRDVIGLVFS